MVWYSAAKTTSDGYVIEVQIPLQTLRFSGGDEVRMGLVFFRKVSRIGVSYAWPEMLPGQWVFDRPSHITFSNLKPRRLVEVLPSVTYGVRQERDSSAPSWGAADNDTHVGASGKFGITSGVTLGSTTVIRLQPVESDVLQITVISVPDFFSKAAPFPGGMGLFTSRAATTCAPRSTPPHHRADLRRQADGPVARPLRLPDALDDHRANFGDRGVIRRCTKMFTIAARRMRFDAPTTSADVTQRITRREQLRGGRGLLVKPSRREMADVLRHDSDGTIDESNCRAGYVDSRRFAIRTCSRALRRDFQIDTAFTSDGFTAAWSYGQFNFYPRSARISGPANHPVRVREVRPDRLQDATRISSTPGPASTSRARALNSIVARQVAWKEEYRSATNVLCLPTRKCAVLSCSAARIGRIYYDIRVRSMSIGVQLLRLRVDADPAHHA